MRILTLGLGLLLFMGCGKKDKDDMMKAGADMPSGDAVGQQGSLFPASYLSDFLSWTPILDGDQAFKSAGHGGIIVRTYMNSVAADHAMKASNPFPLPEGAVLAKAVVATMDAGSETASRVYFMKKQSAGFDSEHNDWSYAVANRGDGALAYDSSLGSKPELCISCHAKFKDYDYVQTVSFFKKQSTEL